MKPFRTPGLRGLVERHGKQAIGPAIFLVVGAAGLVVAVLQDPIPTGVGSCWTEIAGTADEMEAVRCGSQSSEYVVDAEVSTPQECPTSSQSYIEDGSSVKCLRDPY